MSETNEPTAASDAPEVTIDAPKADALAEPALPVKFSHKPQLSRSAMLALVIGVSAALGSMVGALAGAAIMRPAADEPSATATLSKGSLSLLSADIASLKASVEASGKVAKAQAQQLADRIERVEKAASEAAKTAKLVEPADKKTQAPEITGSIPLPKDAPRASVLPGWVLRDVSGGRAMIENRYGLYEVGPGSNVPGLGYIEAIRRQDGRWVVVTPRGIIVSLR
jgi:hypothetical protein